MTSYYRLFGYSSLLFLFQLTLSACDTAPQSGADPQLVSSCAECHGDGQGAIEGWPPLTSMTEQEIVAKLTGHRARVVADSTMARVAHDLSDDEIQQLAEHFAQE